ncbi:MAG: hypothetical protein WD227_04190 [Vicinamibacterales bacterium]
MRSALVVVLLAVSVACERTPAQEPSAPAVEAAPAAASEAPSAAAPTVAATPVFPLRIEGTGFVDASGKPFTWRGITSFQLAEMVAHGREQEAAAYLDWAKSEDLTVVRVLLTAQHLFELTPAEGRKALPRLLDLAKERGLAVEVVALADTKDRTLDYDAHIREVGRVALEKGNAFVEIANEPGHDTQDPRLHDAAFAKHLADLLPEPLIVALGSFEYGESYAAGDYATTHVPRGDEGWDHVFKVAERAGRVEQLKKPVVSDEPMGAGPEYQPGRRDNDPARFAAAAALTRLVGMAATFHYEGGLYSKIPAGPEAASLAAWKAGLALVGEAAAGEFLLGAAIDRLARTGNARHVYARATAEDALVLLIDPGPAPSVTWEPGWNEVRREGIPGALLVQARRATR